MRSWDDLLVSVIECILLPVTLQSMWTQGDRCTMTDYQRGPELEGVEGAERRACISIVVLYRVSVYVTSGTSWRCSFYVLTVKLAPHVGSF